MPLSENDTLINKYIYIVVVTRIWDLAMKRSYTSYEFVTSRL